MRFAWSLRWVEEDATVSDEMISALKTLGLTEYEAKAYQALLRSEQQTAYQVSAVSGVPRARVYEILQRLVNQSLAGKTGGEPIRYSALPINHFVRNKKVEIEKTLDFVLKAGREIQSDGAAAELILNLKDATDIYTYVNRVISRARTHLFINLSDAHYPGLEKEFKRTRTRKVHILGTIYGETNPLHQSDVLPIVSPRRLAMHTASQSIIVVADESEAVIAHLHANLPSKGVYMLNHFAVHLIATHIRNLRFVVELEKLLGRKAFEKLETRAWRIFETAVYGH
jgi:sugar-specific transcriptional regulator TrmB